ncbi:MAG: hypothetical protein VX898_03000 [Candidatus Thermoplasmatota archaeon]|nr:hypothetical protein [Candidatus Thermoplasmatota archaeon]
MATYYPQTLIYEERKVTYWALASIPFFVFLIIFLWYRVYATMGYFIFLPIIPLFFVILIMYNMTFYSVKVFDNKTLQFGFPKWHIKLQPHEIKSIEETGSYRPIKDFGGLGWRVGRKDGKWKRGYLVWLQKGIEVETVSGIHYVFGTDDPQAILSALGQYGGPARI